MDQSAPASPPRNSVVALFRWSWRFVFVAAAAAYFLLAIGVVGLRYWVLPKVPEYRERIEGFLSSSIGERVTIGAIKASWGTFHPILDIDDIKIYDSADRLALSLGRVAAEVSWRSLAVRELRFHSIVVDQPNLKIRRARDGKLFIAGIEMGGQQADSGPNLGDWVLRQGEVVINSGAIDWTDESRGAPVLGLTGVDFRLINRITGEHRFALQAKPPQALAAAIDVRGQFRGDSLAAPERLRGQLYTHLDYADLAGWKAWVDYPFTVSDGHGALRVWASFAGGKVLEATADVALARVKAKIARDLPELQLAAVEGRIGLREVRKDTGFFGFLSGRTLGYQVFGEQVALTAGAGHRQPPTNFSLQWELRPESERRGAAGEAPDRGEFKADVIAVAPLFDIAEAVPFPLAVRRFLKTHDPRGTLTDIAASWTGDIAAPRTYEARTRFGGFSFVEGENLPGIAGLSGAVEATHRGGSATVSGKSVRFAYPNVLPWTKRIDFDAIDAQVNWSLGTKDGHPHIEVKVPSVRVANNELSLSGTANWHSLPNSPGYLDLELRIPKAEPKALYKYIPDLKEEPATWLRNAFLAGSATDGLVRIRGDIYHFPFVDRKEGEFQVRAKGKGVTLRYVPNWPTFEAIDGEFALDGLSMDITSPSARLYGARLSDVSVRSTNIDDPNVPLAIEGRAEGPTPDFMRFIAESPLNEDLGPVVSTLKPQGRGRLALQLSVPLRRPQQTKVAGSYEFTGNELAFSPADPPLTQLTGKLDFHERGVSAKQLAAQFLGGPIQFDLETRPEGGFTIGAQGRANVALLKKSYPFPFDEYFDGAAAYTASVSATPESFDMRIESPLQGVKIDLPAPFGKSASESSAFKFERIVPEGEHRKDAAERNQVTVSLGTLINMRGRFRDDAGASVLDRASVTIGDTPLPLPARPELAIKGQLATLDLDRLAPILRKFADTPGAGPGKGMTIAPISMRAGTLTALGRRMNDAMLEVNLHPDGWFARVHAKEMDGTIDWHGGGAGKVKAAFKRLTLPELVQPGVVPSEKEVLRELPALDVTADSFAAHGKEFGRLELKALDEKDGWRIEKFSLSAPDGTISGEGWWQLPDRGNRTEVNVLLQVSDVGQFLGRMGQSNAVAGGRAKLSGKIAWNGPPTAIDYPSLVGSMSLNAESGRFLKAEPGIARLLGVLSLQSLPRRMSLDFRDVFSEGFAFDEITGTASIAKGIMNTRDFRMVGPAAGVGLVGDVDLDRETQQLRVRVVPVVGDSVAAVAALALLNPLVGLGTFLAQRMLQDPLGQILAYEYTLAGTWADPKVERVPSQTTNGANKPESSGAP